jgi:transcription initiation factor TFIIB
MSHIKDIEYSGGKKPASLSATILYLMVSKTSEYISLKEIAKAAGVTEVTIRTRFQDREAGLLAYFLCHSNIHTRLPYLFTVITYEQ